MAAHSIAQNSIDVIVTEHRTRIETLEKSREEDRADVKAVGEKVDGLRNWIMGVLATAVIGFVGVIVTLLIALSSKH